MATKTLSRILDKLYEERKDIRSFRGRTDRGVFLRARKTQALPITGIYYPRLLSDAYALI